MSDEYTVSVQVNLTETVDRKNTVICNEGWG